jgi:hypothetical protein
MEVTRSRVLSLSIALLLVAILQVWRVTPAQGAVTVCRHIAYMNVSFPGLGDQFVTGFTKVGNFLAGTYDQDLANSLFVANFATLSFQSASTVWVGFYNDDPAADDLEPFKGWAVYLHTC